MKVGAFDFLQKPIDPEVFLSTVRRAVTEDYYARKLGFSPKDCEPAYASLTDRERGIAVFIASGLENHVIAERLGLSVKRLRITRRAFIRSSGSARRGSSLSCSSI